MLRPRLAVTAALFAIVTIAAARPFTAQQSAPEVAAALQAKYDRIRDFTADFTQQNVTILKKKSTQHRGKVQIKKPGKMRWDYHAPEKQLFVSDGTTVYLWVPADNQVTQSPVPKESATSAVMFLAGKGNIVRDFAVTFTQTPPPGTHGLRLQPKLPERDYEWLELVVDRVSLQIRQLTAADGRGQNTFTFTNFKENVGLSDKTFEFKIPRGADVVHAGGSAR